MSDSKPILIYKCQDINIISMYISLKECLRCRCKNNIDDEYHFFLYCQINKNLRTQPGPPREYLGPRAKGNMPPPGRVKPNTIELVFVAFPLSTYH